VDLAQHGGVALHVGTERVPQPLVASFPDEVKIQFAKRREKAVRVVGDQILLVVGDAHPVVGGLVTREFGLPQRVLHVLRGELAVEGFDDDRLGEGA